MEAGGIFVQEAGDCQATSPVSCPDDETSFDCLEVGDGEAILDFEQPNGYYAWPETIVSGVLPPETTDFSDPTCGEPPLNRTYMTIVQTNSSIDWYNEQTGPRMLTVSYNSIHTPYQQPHQSLTTPPASGELVCGEALSDRILGNTMLESMDREIGRLLASLNLATLDEDGTIETIVDNEGNTQIPELQTSNTMVVVVGDNGSFFPVVKLPFDTLRSKGSVYETGVRVPLMVAGPLVQGPTGREVDALVNVADLFELFAEMAGVDVDEAVPPAHILDSQPVLPYLTNPGQEPIRDFNFTQLGTGVFQSPVNEQTRSWPCVLQVTAAQVCNDIISNTQSFCNSNNGVWWGPVDPPDKPEQPVIDAIGLPAAFGGLSSCCQVQAALEMPMQGPPEAIIIGPLDQFAVRNQTYKLVQLSFPVCSPEEDDGSFPPDNLTSQFEFYDLTDTSRANPLGLDFGFENLLCAVRLPNENATCRDRSPCDIDDPTSCLNDDQSTNFNALQEELQRIMQSQVACEGDGNLDARVDQSDAEGVEDFASAVSPLTGKAGGQSFFDFNTDAETNAEDAQIVASNFDTDCFGLCRRADLNRDGFVNSEDANLLEQALGPCDLCGADLNNDGVVNDIDASILDEQLGCSTPTPTPTPVS